MPWYRWMILTAVPGILTGCFVQSLYPCHTEENLVKVPELVGAWREADDEKLKNPPWVFGEDQTIVTYGEGTPSAIEARYFRIGDHLFTDWTAGDPGDNAGINLYWRIHVMRTHSVLKVDLEGDRLALTPMDLEWATKTLSQDPPPLSHLAAEEDDRPLITATPEDWETFLRQHAANDAAFKPDSAMNFVRVSPNNPESDSSAPDEE